MSLAVLVQGLGYGDEGKGQSVHRLASEFSARLVIRFNGGAQAGHNVITTDGRHHTFSQFGSGSFLPNVGTHLSQFMTVNPLALMNEADHLSRVARVSVDYLLGMLTIDRRAPVVTPFHKAVNRSREMDRGSRRHGSCGMGIGECQADFLEYPDRVLLVGDLKDKQVIEKKLRFIVALENMKVPSIGPDEGYFENLVERYWQIGQRLRIVDELYLREWFKLGQTVIFEGAQGVLLDEKYGFAPYHSWSDCTFVNAYKILIDANFQGEMKRFGVLRAYATRHGAGPMVTEDAFLTECIRDPYNVESPWQGPLRIGHFDIPASRYALKAIASIDKMFLTCPGKPFDLPENRVCLSYEYSPEQMGCLTKDGQIPFLHHPTLIDQTQLSRVLLRTKMGDFKSFNSNNRATEYADFISDSLGVQIQIVE